MNCVYQPLTDPYTSRAVPIINTTTWINDNIRQQRRQYRKAERSWKKSKVEVHHLHMKDLLIKLNQTIKDAWAAYFSGLINSNKHNPRFLFSTINQLVNPSLPSVPTSSSNHCFLLARSMVWGQIFPPSVHKSPCSCIPPLAPCKIQNKLCW